MHISTKSVKNMLVGTSGKALTHAEINFSQIEVDLDGVERDVEVEVSVDGSSEYVTVRHEIEGMESLDLSIGLEDVMRAVEENGYTEEALLILLRDNKGFDIVEDDIVEDPARQAGAVETPQTVTEETEKSQDSASSVKETIKSVLSREDDRLLLIGLLVEAGYAVGKKVS